MGHRFSSNGTTDDSRRRTRSSSKTLGVIGSIPSSELFRLDEREMLKKIFKDLVSRSTQDKKIDRETFCRLFPLPGVLGERLFRIFDKEGQNCISKEDFFDGVCVILKGSIEDKIKFLFKLFDLDNVGRISKEDLNTVLHCIVSSQQAWMNENSSNNNLSTTKDEENNNNNNTNALKSSNRLNMITKSLQNANVVVNELLNDALQFMRNGCDYLTLRDFAGFIIEHPYLWDFIEDVFSLSPKNTSLTPGLRRRRSESISQSTQYPSSYPLSNLSYQNSSSQILIDNTLLSNSNKQSFHDLLSLAGNEIKTRKYSKSISITTTKNTTKSTTTKTTKNNNVIAKDNEIIQELFSFKQNPLPLIPDCHGYLRKLGKRFGIMISRWYLLHNNFLYTFKNENDNKPKHILLLHGCQIEAYDNSKENQYMKYGIKITVGVNTLKQYNKILYASSDMEQSRWIRSLKQGADSYVVEDFFAVKEELGTGKFSKVYRCIEKSTKNEFAVKIIKRKSLSIRENQALRTEIAVLRLLNHPNIININHVFETVESISIVMPYISGGDLFDKIVQHKRFSETVAKKIIYKLLLVAQYIHRRGIVHRDLKPENIMCLNDDLNNINILVIDFGLSSFFTPKELLKAPCGTLSYVAPEVLQGQGYTKVVDLWSIGVILYVMIRGRLPFDSKDKTQLIKKVILGKFSMRNQIWNNISKNCKDLLFRLLQTNPNKRINSDVALMHPWFIELQNKPLKSLKSVPESLNENDDILDVLNNNNNKNNNNTERISRHNSA